VDGAHFDTAQRSNYLFNSTIAGIEQADTCVLVGVNPRREASLVNARIRKAWRNNGLKVRLLGNECDLTYPYEYLGNDPRLLNEILDGRDPLAQELAAAKNPMIILGSDVFTRADSAEIFAAVKAIADKYNLVRDGWNGFNVLHHAAGRVGALDLGFVPSEGGRNISRIIDGCRREEVKLVYLLGVDDFDMALLGSAFVIYQGHHGDDGAHRADIVLPGAAYTEKDATYVNMEGRVQRTKRAVFPPGQAKEDWAIIRALSDTLGKPLPYHSLERLRDRMTKVAPHFAHVNHVVPAPWTKGEQAPQSFRISERPFNEFIANFYMTDPISRASKTMAECTQTHAEAHIKRVA
jgi:NADH-quinone oxidoreductase subunit G